MVLCMTLAGEVRPPPEQIRSTVKTAAHMLHLGLWREFGAEYIGTEEAERFDRDFIQPLDESDNTGKTNILADIIDEFNPGWDSGRL